MGWGNFLDAVMDKLPIQGRTERWKNQIEALKKEKEKLLKSEWTYEKSVRVTVIDGELDKLNQLLKNRVK